MKIVGTYFTTKKISNRQYEPSTLTRWVGHCLSELESIFGERDHAFTFLGIEFIIQDGTHPQTYFPLTSKSHKHVLIHLSRGALTSLEHAKWQLAHECTHLLDPVKGYTSNLEEGMATWFQNKQVPYWPSQRINQYTKPWDIVTKIQNEYPDAIKEMRSINNMKLSKPKPDLLKTYLPTLPQHEIDFLCKTFGVE